MAVEHWDPEHEGPLSEQALRRKLEARGYEVHRYVYPPGTVFPAHTHGIDKIDAVLSGRFRMRMQGQSVILQAGDCLAVPRGMVHSAEVVGDEAVVSLDAVADPNDLAISCDLDGERVQESRTANLIFSVPELVAYLSRHCVLEPGDLIFTGTPGGVGSVRDPRRYLKPGETLVTAIEGLGRLENRCVAADA